MKKTKQWRFFQTIHPLIIQNQELGIPRRFVRKYAKDLSDVAVLEDPSGKVWNVSLKRSIDGGDIFFKNGWHDFVEYHSIRNGHFLDFRYHGNSCFHVRIYDITGCEKGNEEKRRQGGEGQPGEKQKEVISLDADSSSNEPPNTLSQQSLWRNGGNKDSKDPTKDVDASDRSNSLESESRYDIQCSVLKGKQVEVESSVEILYTKTLKNPPVMRRSLRCSSNQPITSSSQLVCKSKQEVEMSGSETHSETRPLSRRRATSREDRKRAIHAARQFKSENRFCVVNVRSSYVNGSWMYLPYRFMKTYASMIKYVTLVASNGESKREWRCQLLWYNHKHTVMIYDGWKVFVAETNLKCGNACVFELIDTEHNVFNVSIFRS